MKHSFNKRFTNSISPPPPITICKYYVTQWMAQWMSLCLSFSFVFKNNTTLHLTLLWKHELMVFSVWIKFSPYIEDIPFLVLFLEILSCFSIVTKSRWLDRLYVIETGSAASLQWGVYIIVRFCEFVKTSFYRKCNNSNILLTRLACVLHACCRSPNVCILVNAIKLNWYFCFINDLLRTNL